MRHEMEALLGLVDLSVNETIGADQGPLERSQLPLYHPALIATVPYVGFRHGGVVHP